MERQKRELTNQELIGQTPNSIRGRQRLGLRDHLRDHTRLMLCIVPPAIGAAVLEHSLKAQGIAPDIAFDITLATTTSASLALFYILFKKRFSL